MTREHEDVPWHPKTGKMHLVISKIDFLRSLLFYIVIAVYIISSAGRSPGRAIVLPPVSAVVASALAKC